MRKPTQMLTLTNDHLCSYTDGGKSTYVFYTTPVIEFAESTALESDSKPLERVPDKIKLDRK
jgi:hypothetical protein